eukprot:4204749-Amphidinium_carterae.2
MEILVYWVLLLNRGCLQEERVGTSLSIYEPSARCGVMKTTGTQSSKRCNDWVQQEPLLVGVPNTLARAGKEVEDSATTSPLMVCYQQGALHIRTMSREPILASHGQLVYSDDPSHVIDAHKTEFAVKGQVDPQRMLVDLLTSHLRRLQRAEHECVAVVSHQGDGFISGDSCARAREQILSAIVPTSNRSGQAFARSGYLPFGAVTARGWDRVHPNTESRGGVLAAVHELARHRINQHAYLSAAVVQGTPPWHVDPWETSREVFLKLHRARVTTLRLPWPAQATLADV